MDGARLRHHGREWSVPGTSLGVEIAWTEHVRPGGDRSATDPPALDVYSDDFLGPVTCAQVRMFAELLAEAADYYDRHVR